MVLNSGIIFNLQFCNFISFIFTIERFLLECCKTKIITRANHRAWYKQKPNQNAWSKARENVCEAVTNGYDFTSDWSRNLGARFIKPITKDTVRSKSNQSQRKHFSLWKLKWGLLYLYSIRRTWDWKTYKHYQITKPISHLVFTILS